MPEMFTVFPILLYSLGTAKDSRAVRISSPSRHGVLQVSLSVVGYVEGTICTHCHPELNLVLKMFQAQEATSHHEERIVLRDVMLG